MSSDCTFPGIYRGVVVDNLDPRNQLRLKVGGLPMLGDTDSHWALPCLPSLPSAPPAVGSPVWVMFEGGDPNWPVWMGQWFTPQGTYSPPAPPGQFRIMSGNAGWLWSATAGMTKIPFSTWKYRCGVHCSTANSQPLRVDTLVPHNTIDFDPNNNFSTATHLYTCPFTGYYLVSLGARVLSSSGTGLVVSTAIYKNQTSGNPGPGLGKDTAGDPSSAGDLMVRQIHCNVGDTLGQDVWCDESSSTAIFLDNANGGVGNHMEISLQALG